MARLTPPQPIFDTLENLEEKRKLPKLAFAKKDYLLALDFLKQYRGNQATFESYRREIERLLQWAWLITGKSILKIKNEEIENYIKFCMNPPKSWMGTKRVSRYITQDGFRIPNPDWRPFVVSISIAAHKQGDSPDKNTYQLSQKSIREIFTVLGSFYSYLLLTGKILYNPIALIRQKSKYIQKQQTQTQIMRLTEIQWKYCLRTAKKMASERPEMHERTLFIITAMYLMYLRISEFVASERWTPMMGHFFQNSDGSWWFKVVGKGNKLRVVAVGSAMLSAFTRYRLALKLPPFPSPTEQLPLISKLKGHGPLTSTRQIRNLLEICFQRTGAALREDKLFCEANTLNAATAHWLRHIGISDDVNKRERPILHVRDDAGHSSTAITEKYNDVELAERYKTAKSKTADGNISNNGSA